MGKLVVIQGLAHEQVAFNTAHVTMVKDINEAVGARLAEKGAKYSEAKCAVESGDDTFFSTEPFDVVVAKLNGGDHG